MANFDRFTERARSVIKHARDEARQLKHPSVNTGHLLLGVLDEPEGIGARVLESMGASAAKVRTAVRFMSKPGTGELRDDPELTGSVERVIELAIDESAFFGHGYVGTEHLLLGLIREGNGTAFEVLEFLGVTLDEARIEADRLRQQWVPGDQPPRPATGIGGNGLTERATAVMRFAEEEAKRFQHGAIGTEHLLLGLVRERDGVAAEVLESLEMHPAKIRAQVEFIIGQGDAEPKATLNLTPRSKKVLELAAAESRRLEHVQVGTHHLLLGLVREGDGIAAQVLQSLGITLDNVRTEVVAVLAECAAFQETDLIEEPMPLLSYMTGRVRSIVRFAEEEAKRLGHTYYGTEHLLLGLLREGEGNAVRVLFEAGVTLRAAREAVEAVLGGGNEYATLYAGAAPGYERTLAAAINQSLHRGHHFNGSEHLLLALAEDRESVAGSVFHYLAVDVDDLAARTIAKIDPEWDVDRDNPAQIPDDVGIEPPRFGPIDLTDVQLIRLKSPLYRKSRTTITRLSQLARDEARQLGHPFVGTEHLLIALTDPREGGGAATLLAEMGVTAKTARIAVEVRFGRGTATITETGYTRYGSARLNLVIDQAFDLADPQAGRHVLPEHLLLAILEQEGGSANRVLDSLRIDRAKLRAEVESKLQPDEPDTPTPSAE
jgi:ATP-dependent Clp protease ATP-binding subunit ClpA